MSKMKIAIRSYGSYRDNINGFGGLELRNTVNYAHFLRTEGHVVSFFDDRRGCDSSFDLALDAPNNNCPLVKAKFHVHSWFGVRTTRAVKNPDIGENPCYKNGGMIISDPYRYGYENSKNEPEPTHNFKHVLFLPIPYPDDLLPKNLIPGFDRDVIFWGNKGNFNSDFGPETNMHYITNGIETLKALVRLNKKADFKTVIVLDQYIKGTRDGWRGEVESLIGQLKQVERLGQVTWSRYLDIMGKTKINTHVGGLTSGINECIFTQGLPAVPENFLFFNDVAKELNIIPPPQSATADEIHDAYERLWFNGQYYYHVSSAFQDVFTDHRTEGLRRNWKLAMEELER